MSIENKQAYVAKPFHGEITAENIGIKSVPYPTSGEGEVIFKVATLSVDPYIRGTCAGQPIGHVVSNFVAGTVIESKSDKFAVGDAVYGNFPLQLYVAAPADKLHKIDTSLGLPLSNYVGALGMPGQTALGALEDGGFKAGDVVFVNGAAGAVGSLLGQLARHLGAKKVIGSAGGPEKCKIVVEKYGFDACIDYKEHTTAAAVSKALVAALGDDKIGFFAENTGGHVTDAIWDLMAFKARAVIIGSIADYNNTTPRKVDAFLHKLIYRAVNVRGFIVSNWLQQEGNAARFYATVPKLVKEGTVKIDETVHHGIEKIPEAFVGLFTGANIGKMVINV
jgi:NADPH-dependent curcumin reductase CurA